MTILGRNFVEIIAIFLAIKTIDCAECPDKELISPCVCESLNLVCDRTTITLDSYFKYLSQRLTASNKSFNRFVIRNSGITDIEDNTFNGITFTSITIENVNSLQRIAPKAFAGTNTLIQEFHLFGQSNITESKVADFFAALNSLYNAKNITLNQNLLKSLPSSAFNNNEHRFALEYLSFGEAGQRNGSIRSVGRQAFYSLSKLHYLSLEGHQIERIKLDVFDFNETSDAMLIINLSNNNLEGASFEFGSFQATKRPVVVALSNNQLTYLDENVFNPLLHQNHNNRIDLTGNPIECDCRMYWLTKLRFEMRDNVKDQMVNVVCHGNPYNGKSFWDLRLSDFDNCLNG